MNIFGKKKEKEIVKEESICEKIKYLVNGYLEFNKKLIECSDEICKLKEKTFLDCEKVSQYEMFSTTSKIYSDLCLEYKEKLKQLIPECIPVRVDVNGKTYIVTNEKTVPHSIFSPTYVNIKEIE